MSDVGRWFEHETEELRRLRFRRKKVWLHAWRLSGGPGCAGAENSDEAVYLSTRGLSCASKLWERQDLQSFKTMKKRGKLSIQPSNKVDQGRPSMSVACDALRLQPGLFQGDRSKLSCPGSILSCVVVLLLQQTPEDRFQRPCI